MQDEVTLAAPTQMNAARGDFVVRRGTFFRVGEYPDKQFGLSEAEADAAIAGFAPVPLNIEHIPTIFDGKLGMVRRVVAGGADHSGRVRHSALAAGRDSGRANQDQQRMEPDEQAADWRRVRAASPRGRCGDAGGFQRGKRRKEKGERPGGMRH